MVKYLIMLGSFVMAVWLASAAIDLLGLGRLPGDIVIERRHGRGRIYIPIATTLLLSFTFSLIYWLVASR